MALFFRNSIKNILLLFFVVLISVCCFTTQSSAQQLRIRLISVSSNIDNTGRDNYTWHVKWKKDGGSSFVDKCYTASNNGPLVYPINQTFNINYLQTDPYYTFFTLVIEGWEENKGDNCSFNNSGSFPDRDYAILTKNISYSSLGSPYQWKTGSITATNQHSPAANYVLIYQTYYIPKFSSPTISVSDPVCPATDDVLITPSAISPSGYSYKVDWQYHVYGDVITTTIPNPAYCGPCGPGDPQDPIFQQSLATLLPLPSGSNLPCCNVPPFITTTQNAWRTLVLNVTPATYTIPPSKLREMVSRGNGGLAEVRVKYRVRYNGVASSYSSFKSLSVNPPAPELEITGINPRCKGGAGEIRINTTPTTDTTGIAIRWPIGGGNYNQKRLNQLPYHEKTITFRGITITYIDYYFIENLQAGAYDTELFYANTPGVPHTSTSCINVETINLTDPTYDDLTADIDEVTHAIAGNNGTILLAEIEDGKPGAALTYSISNNATPVYQGATWNLATKTFSSLKGNITYTVKIDDTCKAWEANVFIGPKPISGSVPTPTTTTAVNCYGESDGEFKIDIEGYARKGVLQYKITKGATTFTSSDKTSTNHTFTGLIAGNYQAWVRDKGYGASVNYQEIGVETEIKEPDNPLVLSETLSQHINVSCNGESTGQIEVISSGGTPSYTYSISPMIGVMVINKFTNLPFGDYTITVEDGNNCLKSLSISISQNQQLNAIITTTNTSCFGERDGTFNVGSITNGNGNNVILTLLKKSGSSFVPETINTITSNQSHSFTNLNPGTYKVELINTEGTTTCNYFSSIEYEITQPAEIIFDNISTTNETCLGANNGTIIPAMLGGNTGYYFLTNKSGAGWVALGNLATGVYEIKAVNEDGCESIYAQSIVIEGASQALGFTWVSDDYDGIYDLQCATATTSITLTPSGGWGNYQFAIDGGNYSAVPYIQNLNANTNYMLWLKDAENCIINQQINLKAPPAITSTFSITPINCYGDATGIIAASPTGGLGNYEYRINGSNGTTNPIFESLLAGNHTILIDDGACSATFIVNVPENDPIVIDFDINHIDCFGTDNGIIIANVSGGVAPYALVWSNTQTTNTISDLVPGFYSLNITDAVGCTFSQQAEVLQPGATLALSINTTNVTCKSKDDGIIEFIASGGTSPYQYSINNGTTYSTNAIRDNLQPASYQLSVIDANGCTTTLQTTITEPEILEAQLEQKENVLCFGEYGTIDIKGLGGIPPYQFSIDGEPFSDNDGLFTSVFAGNHTIIINDANNCAASIDVELTQPALPLDATFMLEKVTCKGQGNGAISSIITGGTAPYEVVWDNDARTSQDIDNLNGGAITITITDVNGCVFNQELLIEEPEFAISTSYVKNDISCNGLIDGSIEIMASGGYGTYEYSFNNGTFSSVNYYNGLPAGTYNVQVKDIEGCVFMDAIEIIEPDVLAGSLSVTSNVLCFNGNDGIVSFFAIGGTSPYRYSLNGSTFQSSYIFEGLVSGVYQVNITDANNCVFTSNSVFVNQPNLLEATISNILNASCNRYNGQAKVNPTGGASPYSFEWSHRQEGILSNSQYPTNLKSGVYDVKIIDANLCEFVLTQIMNDDDGPVGQITSFIDATCFNGSNGSANAVASGGAGGYSYAWTNGETGNEATQLARGEHFVKITDARGCTYTVSVEIGSPQEIDLQVLNITQPLCFDSCEGTATVSAFGGIAPYTYNWPAGVTANGATATGLCAGVYDIIIIDTNGCEQVKSVVVDTPTPISVNFSIVQPTCNGFLDGSIAATIAGGVGNYQLSWDGLPGKSNVSVTDLAAGFYTLTVVDDNGCTLITQTELTEPVPLTINLGEDKILCANQELMLDAAIGGGTYKWLKDGNSISQNQQVETTGTGVYKVNLTDAFGCSATDEIFINQISNSLEVSFLSATEIEVGDSLKLVDISWEVPDDLMWDYGTEVTIIEDNLWSPIIQYSETGTYEIKLTAYLSGCIDSLTKVITLLETTDKSTSGRMAEVKGIKEISVFPNPTDGKFSIYIELYAKEELALFVYNITGGVIERHVFDENIIFRNDFNLIGQKQGIYLVQILTPSEEKMVRIFIK